ncbi:hypothetical protein M8542_16015 [Amycolatopsis sp. OK19-0408]|uniref:Uncharacterized protein n=1 Tax=Amycolatopsis iheyensis TaxID=2945988 RepID=A0A9X2SJC9_9PSEU|nr:hypothetical protein [Amycolatopsis iheyensis]MCR6484329.1 hypothetical protein [Amycolatopsis iheyensis]
MNGPDAKGTSGPFGVVACADQRKSRTPTPENELGFALVDQGSRTAAKVVVGILGGLYLIAGLGLTAFAAFFALAFNDTGSTTVTKTVLYTAAALAIWILLTGIGAIVVAMEAEEASTAWLGGLGVLALGVVILGAYAVWFFTKP